MMILRRKLCKSIIETDDTLSLILMICFTFSVLYTAELELPSADPARQPAQTDRREGLTNLHSVQGPADAKGILQGHKQSTEGTL